MTGQTSDGPSTPDESAENTRPRWMTWGLISGASLISIGLAAYEIAPASVTPVIRDSLAIDSTSAGLVVGVMFGAAVVASLPAGAVLDRTNSRTAMATAVLALLVAGSWGWFAGGRGQYWSLIASRVFGGVAYVVVWNAGIDMISRAVHNRNRATAVGIFTASGPIGFALGQGTGPLVTNWFGWPAIFLAFTGIALLGLGLFWPSSRGLGRRQGDKPSPNELGAVFRNRNVWLIGLLGFLGYSLYLFVNSWGSSYLTDEIGLTLAASGILVAVFPAVGVVSRVSSGLVSDRIFRGRRRPVILGSFVVVTPLLVAFTHIRTVPVLVAFLLVAGYAVQLTLGLSFTYIQEVVDVRVAATAVAFQTSIGLAGAFLAPIVGGAIVDTAGFDTAFLLAGVLGGCGVVIAWYAPEPANL
jgi:predicted MFS family arabinose efflux permease